MLGDPGASSGTSVVMRYMPSGKRHDFHYGSAGRGRSRVAESLGVQRSEIPLDDITYRFIDEDDPKECDSSDGNVADSTNPSTISNSLNRI